MQPHPVQHYLECSKRKLFHEIVKKNFLHFENLTILNSQMISDYMTKSIPPPAQNKHTHSLNLHIFGNT